MSRFATPGQGIFQGFRASDDRVVTDRMAWSDTSRLAASETHRPGVLWSGSRFCGGGGGFAIDDVVRFGVDLRQTGGQKQLRIVGTTRDNSNNPMANCIVQGFRTSDDLYVGVVTSDNGGYFELPTQYTTAHYLVAYKTGSPDQAGTTVNTLVGV